MTEGWSEQHKHHKRHLSIYIQERTFISSLYSSPYRRRLLTAINLSPNVITNNLMLVVLLCSRPFARVITVAQV